MKSIFILFLLGLVASCNSIQKHNEFISKEISVESLQKDIDFVKKKLLKKHIDIDLYLPKDSIVFKLDSLKNSLKSPMKPNDFSRELSKVISQFGHGHTYVSRLTPRLTKAEKKIYGYQTSILQRGFPVVQYIDGSYSMAAILSASLQGENRAVFIGEETGGDFNGTVAGRTLTDELKYSKLHLSYGLMTIKPNVQRSLKGRGVLPNIPVEQNFEDAINQKDTQLEAVIQHIQKKTFDSIQ